jgi:uncharacterized protein YdiU (UPF0061 family)
MSEDNCPIRELGSDFYDVVEPATFPKHILRFRNDRWAARVGLDGLSDQEWLTHFARFEPLPDNLSEPLALRYHGHQFRNYNPNLGDGRGFLFAQLRDQKDDRLLDLGTKGSGQTPYSRRGDGRLTLKGGVREILATEMLEARGVYTSKTFSLVETGEQLQRHDEPSPTRSCVLVRLNHSHIRFGTFQRFAALGEHDNVEKLLHYSVRHYYPHLAELPTEEKAAAFLRTVMQRTADLCAQWMAAGFVHGVLNTDNMNITGESFDYGPWRFIPSIDASFTAAYFDHSGLYAYGRQPSACLWNIARLGECLLEIIDQDTVVDITQEYEKLVTRCMAKRFLDMLGLSSAGIDHDEKTFATAIHFLEETGMSYARFLYDWFAGVESKDRALNGSAGHKYTGAAFDEFLSQLQEHPATNPGALDDPYFQRDEPLDMVIETMESLWDPIDQHDDWSALEDAVARIRHVGALYGHNPSDDPQWLPSKDWMLGGTGEDSGED